MKGDLHRRQNIKSLKYTIIVADRFFQILSLPLIVLEILRGTKILRKFNVQLIFFMLISVNII